MRRVWPRIAGFIALGTVAIIAADRLCPPDLSRYQQTGTEVLARDGARLAVFPVKGGTWRLRTTAGDVDPRYLDMLIAAEDRHFWSHPGIDPLAMLRAAVQWAGAGHIVSGGSTLSMQTARLLEPHRRGLRGKLHDMLRALQLERRYSKSEILAMYLTLAPFGGNVESVRAASLAWFGHDAARLTASEAALLVTLPQSPSRRRPDRHWDAATAAVARLSSRLDLPDAGRAPVPAARHAMPRLAGLFAAAQARRAPPGSVLTTTIDASLQKRLESLLDREMAAAEPQAGVAAMIVGNRSRDVLASVGGRGGLYPGGALDLTMTRRSPGSALKPFIYGLAFDAGLLHPLTLIPDAPNQVAGYAPHNFDYEFHGAVTARTALRQSFNVPAVEVLSLVGSTRFVAALRQAGAVVALPGREPSLAVALGGLGINLRDMVMLYAALGDDGRSQPLRGLRGEPPPPRRDFMGRLAVYYLRQILAGSPPPPGMAYAVLSGGREVAFKTGTSFGFRDAWAVGYSGSATVGVWTGRADGTPRPGAFGRAAAAPLMLDIFALLPPEEPAEAEPPPGAIEVASTADLPAGLRRLAGFAANAWQAERPRLSFPPAGATLELARTPTGELAAIDLRASGGTPPFRWLVNGAPVAGNGPALDWAPDGPGSVRVTVIDADDRAASARFRLLSAE